jgi:DNA-binding XRE family transcriptional regulator
MAPDRRELGVKRCHPGRLHPNQVPLCFRMDIVALVETARRRQRLPRPELRRLIREEAHVSQEELAASLGVRRATISRWESGSRTPTGSLLDAYIQALARLSEVA